MPRRNSFAARVKAASKRSAPRTQHDAPQPAEGPATARLREREIAANPSLVAGAERASRPTKAARRRATPAPTSRSESPQETNRQPPTSNLQSPTSNAPKPQSEPDSGYVAVGRVLGPFGLKGELKVQPLTDNPERFRPKSKLFAGLQPVSVLRSREAAGHLYVTFKGFADRDSTEKFRHALLQVPESALPPLPDGEYYRFQLIGLDVVDRDGAPLGTLDEIIETGANDVYRVRTPAGADVLLAALGDVIVTIDLAARRMVVDPPDWR